MAMGMSRASGQITSSCSHLFLLHLNTVEALFDHVYPGLRDGVPTPEFLAERAVLAARNVDVNSLNDDLLGRLPGDDREYKSIDSVSTEDEQTFGEEYLNSLDVNGVPPHKLRLKVGAPIILIRNINPIQGLCNGTRLQVTHLERNVVGAVIWTGVGLGRSMMLPKIKIVSAADGDMSFKLIRVQYPVRLAFPMTMNKSQGQSLKYVGVNVQEEVFSHGQLCGAVPRKKG